jgi:hypothetical protein
MNILHIDCSPRPELHSHRKLSRLRNLSHEKLKLMGIASLHQSCALSSAISA